MTLDEAIQHYYELSNNMNKCAEISASEDAKQRLRGTANQHMQIAEWLMELKQFKEAGAQPVDRRIDAQKNPPPITDRKSMTSDAVLIMRDNGRCSVAYYCFDPEEGNCWLTEDEKTMYDLEEVTYWMPLPKSLMEGETNDL